MQILNVSYQEMIENLKLTNRLVFLVSANALLGMNIE